MRLQTSQFQRICLGDTEPSYGRPRTEVTPSTVWPLGCWDLHALRPPTNIAYLRATGLQKARAHYDYLIYLGVLYLKHKLLNL